MATSRHVTLRCPYVTEASTTNVCRNGLTQCIANADEAAAALNQLYVRMATHLVECHDHDSYESAAELAGGITPDFLTERDTAPNACEGEGDGEGDGEAWEITMKLRVLVILKVSSCPELRRFAQWLLKQLEEQRMKNRQAKSARMAEVEARDGEVRDRL